MTGCTPLSNLTFNQIIKKILKDGYRAEIKDDVPEAYRNLICSCWSQLPENRPSFDQIVSDLKNNHDFITETIDESEFYDYVDFIDNFKSTFDRNNQLIHFEDFIKNHGRNKLIRKVSFNEFDDKTISEKDRINNLNKIGKKDEPAIHKNLNKIKEDETTSPDDQQKKEENCLKIKENDNSISNDNSYMNNKDEYFSKEESPRKIKEEDKDSIENLQNCREKVSEKEKITEDSINEYQNHKIEEDEEINKPAQGVSFNSVDDKKSTEELISKEESNNVCLTKGESSNSENLQKITEEDSENKNNCQVIKEEASMNDDNSKESKVESMNDDNSKESKEESKQDNIEKKFFFGFDNLSEENKNLVRKAENDCYKQFLVGKYLIEGSHNFPRNVSVGIGYINRSESMKCKESILYHTQMLIKGKIIYKNIQKAKTNLQDSIFSNDPNALVLLGMIAKKENDFARAVKYFQEGERLGDNECCFKLSKMIYSGEGIKKNHSKALENFETLKIKGHKKSEYFLISYQAMKNKKGFNNLSAQTQLFLISNSIKNDIKNNSVQFKKIQILPMKTEMLFYNGSLKSAHFYDFLLNYKEVSIEIQQTSQSFKIILDLVSKIKKKIIKCINIGIAISDFNSIKTDKTKYKKDFYLTIDPSIHAIPEKCFYKDKYLIQIVIPPTIIKIGKSAFSECSKLRQIDFQSSSNSCLTSISECSFYNCSSLEQIEIPSSIMLIEKSAFEGCSSLKQIEIPSSLISVHENAFKGVKSLKITGSIQNIVNNMFNGLTTLTKIKIPSSVTLIGMSAFEGCSSLLQIAIPSSVIKIDKKAFSGCFSLKQVSFDSPSSLKCIEEYAFQNCASLTEISIPPSVEEIGYYAFGFCLLLKKINILALPPNVKYEINKPFYKKTIYITPDEFDEPDIKILALGAGDSGKTYLLNHFKFLFLNPISDDDKNDITDVIRINTISYIQSLIESYKSSGYNSKNKQLLDSISKVSELHLVADELTPEISDCISLIWKNSDFQTVYENHNSLLIDEYASYFLNNVSRIGKSDYIPTDDDIIRVRQRTTSIMSLQFRIDNQIKVEIIDVGGQKCERSKWQRCFQGVDILFFVMSLSDFDEFCFEDDNTSRIQDSINFLIEACTSPVFVNKPVLIILNNKDLFEGKLKQNTEYFLNVFPSFKGNPLDTNECINHIKNELLSGLSEKRSTNNINVFSVTTTNKYSVIDLFNEIVKVMKSIFST